MATKHIYFVRHGETEGNLGKFFQFSDTKLSEAGYRGAKALAQRFKHMQVDALYASTFTRAQQTASYIAEIKNIPVTSLEYFHEKLHAQSIRGVKHDAPEAVVYKKEYTEKFWTEGWNHDGAENYFDVRARLGQGLSVLERDSSEHIVVVAHADFIRTVTAYLLSGCSDDAGCVQTIFNNLEKMSNVAISEFLYTDNQWSLLHWNDHAHFAE
jgi:broad specificity phosphatase PhoE